MRRAFHHDLANARIADLRHHVAQQRTAKAAIRTRRAHTQHRTRSVPAHTVTGLTSQVLTQAISRHPWPAQ